MNRWSTARRTAGLLAAAAGLAAAAATPAAAAPAVSLKKVGTFAQPVLLTSPPGDNRRQMVVEQAGVVRVIRDGRKLRTPFLDIRRSVLASGERGLLSLAFAPDYATTRRFYVLFTDRNGDVAVQEYRRSRRSRNFAERGSARRVLTERHRRFSNHNGGHLAFGPDRRLYISIGDGGGGNDPFNAGQRLNTRLGKLLRIDPRGSGRRPFRVPSYNPFVGRRGARSSIWAYGLRNPWRFSFDRQTGDLTLADVGQGRREEVNFFARGDARHPGGRGANFGWSAWEGTLRHPAGSADRAPGHDPPVLEYANGGANCAVTGGYVVRTATLPPALQGRYVFADFCAGDLLQAKLDGPRPRASSLGVNVPWVSSFGEDASGRLYAVSRGGPVYRLGRP